MRDLRKIISKPCLVVIILMFLLVIFMYNHTQELNKENARWFYGGNKLLCENIIMDNTSYMINDYEIMTKSLEAGTRVEKYTLHKCTKITTR